MTQEKFKDLIEAPTKRSEDFWERIKIKSVIADALLSGLGKTVENSYYARFKMEITHNEQ